MFARDVEMVGILNPGILNQNQPLSEVVDRLANSGKVRRGPYRDITLNPVGTWAHILAQSPGTPCSLGIHEPILHLWPRWNRIVSLTPCN